VHTERRIAQVHNCGERLRYAIAFPRNLVPLRRKLGLAVVLEQLDLLPFQKAQLYPAKDVIHDRFGVTNPRGLGPPTPLKAHVAEFVAQHLQR
jgi:hypothetical protein